MARSAVAAKGGLVLLTRSDSFDYGDLPKSDVAAMEKHAAAIETTQEQVRRISGTGVIAIGKELKAAQERLAKRGGKHEGIFLKWAKRRCGYKKSNTYRLIYAYQLFSQLPNLERWDASALYLLSAESCPPKARKEAIREAEKGESITHKRAKELKTKYQPSEGEPQVNANGRKVPVSAKTPLSERAKIARDEIGNEQGAKRLKAIMRARFHSESTYRAAAQVEASANKKLIKAMDTQVLVPRDAALLIPHTAEVVDQRIEEAKLRIAKNQESKRSKEKTKPEMLLDLLDRTWLDWRGFANGFPVNSALIPKRADQLNDCERLLPQVRQVVNQLLSAVEKEVANVRAKKQSH